MAALSAQLQRPAGRRETPPPVPQQVPAPEVYRRRRLAVGGAVVFVLALLVGAGQVLANRGGDPASIPAVRPAQHHVVQPGETLWSLAGEHHGAMSQSAYLDRLLDANDGSQLQVGQVVLLP